MEIVGAEVAPPDGAPPELTVSVVTPSFNQARFLPGCLASVAEQTHPACEHLVFDPGSTDGSRDIAKSAGVTLIAEPDRGQAHAVGLGFEMAQGDVLGWLNADDRYANRDVLAQVVDRFARSDQPDIVYGRGMYVSPEGSPLEPASVQSDPEALASTFARGVGMLQPATFVHRRVVSRIGVPDPALNFAMDYEFWMRAHAAGFRFVHLPELLAHATVHPDAKTVAERGASLAEAAEVSKTANGWLSDSWARRLADHRINGADGMFDITRPGDPGFAEIVAASRKLLWNQNRRGSSAIALLQRVIKGDRAALATVAWMLGRTPPQ